MVAGRRVYILHIYGDECDDRESPRIALQDVASGQRVGFDDYDALVQHLRRHSAREAAAHDDQSDRWQSENRS